MPTVKKIPKEVMAEGAEEAQMPAELTEEEVVEEAPAPVAEELPPEQTAAAGNVITIEKGQIPEIADAAVGDKVVMEVVGVNDDGTMDLSYAKEQTA